MAESNSTTLCNLLGIACHNEMSENELNWWLARATKRPFPADQVNIFGAHERKRKHINWFYKPMLEDEEFVKAAKKKIKEVKERKNVQNNRRDNT